MLFRIIDIVDLCKDAHFSNLFGLNDWFIIITSTGFSKMGRGMGDPPPHKPKSPPTKCPKFLRFRAVLGNFSKFFRFRVQKNEIDNLFVPPAPCHQYVQTLNITGNY